MGEFTYFYRGSEIPESSKEARVQLEKWSAWFKDLGAGGCLKDPGHPLAASGKFVLAKGKIVRGGTFEEAKDVIAGFSVVVAQDIAHATELSKDCPILESGGSVEIRPVRTLNK